MRFVSSVTPGAVVILLLLACAREPIPVKVDAPGSPEAVYREFMLASLEGSEARIRPLIIDAPGAETLWQGAYPPQVAKLLAAQYRTMKIDRVAEATQRVTLKSPAAPTALDVTFDGNSWRLDPAPIIEFRRKKM